ncbi:glycosyltransferase [Roseomonas sp. KE2513]|uniref:glycosyltransferase family 2 protein n=1 Tax=Roseomonas sp. KE2513 TaxID=2479202 RepID=UPI0018DF9125|nr:glycosyltransferase family A protein [Roseomonas sp. KE2513]MBI0537912.1 glycosyltransferase [Roseomonas sp. KE2513]
MPAASVSVVVPTFRRPVLLRGCLEALLRQTLWQQAGGEILVVDNCPDGSAGEVVAGLPEGPVPVRYLAERRPGISHARNRGVEEATGEFLSFVDDDIIVEEGAIAALLTALQETGASATFGCCLGVPEAPCSEEALHFLGPYSRDLGPVRRDVTAARAHLGTGLSLMPRAILAARQPPFDPALGLLGGEDAAMIRELAEEGHRFVYEPASIGHEHVSLARLNRAALMQRRFRAGQIRVANAGGPLRRGIWRGVGAAQAALHLPAALVAGLAGQRRRAETHWGQAWGGLGKVFWRMRQAPVYGGGGVLASTLSKPPA